MRRGRLQGFVLAFTPAFLAAVAISSPEAAAKVTKFTATAAILTDGQTGEVLWQRNADLRLPPASTTKALTALVAIKSNRLSESFRVSVRAARTKPSKIRLRPGWRLKLRDLLYAVLLNSANDASAVVAEGLAGSITRFADQMNGQARALGALNSHFVNPHGLPAENHYSTARDLTTIFAAGLRLPLFRKILSTKRVVITPTHGGRRNIVLRSRNRLLLSDYPIRVIGKTGWTRAAKKCFVGAANIGGREIVFAMLGSHDLWGDVKRLLEKGFLVKVGAAQQTHSTPDLAEPSAQGSANGSRTATDPGYEVHLAWFRGRDAADRLRKAVARQGYVAEVERMGTGKQARYRVIIGGYSSFRDARLAARRLDRLHRLKSVIAKVGA